MSSRLLFRQTLSARRTFTSIRPTCSWSDSYHHRKLSTSSSSKPPFNPSPFKLTDSPNPGWKLQDGMPVDTELGKQWKLDEDAGWKSWDTAQMSPVDVYRMLSSAITPRPIAFVSTVASDGVRNLAPMSFFQMVAFRPPLVMISLTIPRNRPKDTRENILATKEFVVNLISEPFIEAANATSVEAPVYVDEWVVAGLNGLPSTSVKPERVEESAVSLECTYYSHQDIIPDGEQEPATTIIIGRIQHAHIRNAVLGHDGLQVDPAKLRVLSRLGGDTYARVSEGFNLSRPSWKKVKEKIGDKL